MAPATAPPVSVAAPPPAEIRGDTIGDTLQMPDAINVPPEKVKSFLDSGFLTSVVPGLAVVIVVVILALVALCCYRRRTRRSPGCVNYKVCCSAFLSRPDVTCM